MTRLDTPLGPDPRSAKTVAGAAGKDQLKRFLTGGRDEHGSAFGALLKALDPKKPHAKADSPEKPEKPEKAEKAEKADKQGKADDAPLAALAETLKTDAPGAPSTEPALPPGPEQPAASTAAQLLLGPFQMPESKPAATDKPAEARLDRSLRAALPEAALSDALTSMTGSTAREAGASHVGKFSQQARAEAGFAMPNQEKAPAPDLSLLTQLADALKDPKAPKASETAESGAVTAQPQAEDGDKAQPARGGEGGSSPLTIAVTHQETHLPPVTRLSPFQQVVEPIRQAAAELVASSRASDAIPELDSVKPTEIASPTKLLHLELRPVELGTITIKMRLSQGGMEMRIETSRAETATMLSQDKDALREVIRASGYSADAVTVETVHVDSMPGDWQRAAHRQDNTQPQTPDGRDGGGRGFNEFRQGDQGHEARRQGWTTQDAPANKDDTHDVAETRRPAGGDPHLYL